jgi:hypothetical protein
MRTERLEEGQERMNGEKGFYFENIEITPEKDFAVDVHIHKQPIEIHDGDTVGPNSVEVKFNNETADLLKEAEKIQGLPEEQRLSALVTLVHGRLKYPYESAIAETTTADPQLAEWLQERFSAGARKFNRIPLNECLKKGYGDCKIMTTAYLAAAQAAKLKGIYASSGETIKNISRPDTGQPIFKSVEVDNDMTSGHAWAEIQLSDGRWIPVDPTTDMIGIGGTLETFKKAGYRTVIPFTETGLPNELRLDRGDSFFDPGEAEKDLQMQLKIGTAQGKPKIDRYTGNINFTISSSSPYLEANEEKKMELSFNS